MGLGCCPESLFSSTLAKMALNRLSPLFSDLQTTRDSTQEMKLVELFLPLWAGLFI
jgi:hypothetical protein